MAISLYLGQVIGWYLVIMGIFLFFRVDTLKSVMMSIILRRELILILAVFTIMIGLLMVCAHNIWLWGWPVLITLMAWMTLIAGILRLFFPVILITMGEKMLNSKVYLISSSIFTFLLGLYLLFEVYATYLR